MPTNLTDVDAFTSPVAVPAGSDTRNAASVETPFQALANRTRYLNNILFASPLVVQPWQCGFDHNLWKVSTVAIGAPFLEAQANSIATYVALPLIGLLPIGSQLNQVRVQINPGAARMGTDRMSLTLIEHDPDFSSPIDYGFTEFSPVYDDTTMDPQLLVLPSLTYDITANLSPWLRVFAGQTAGTDIIAHFELTFSAT